MKNGKRSQLNYGFVARWGGYLDEKQRGSSGGCGLLGRLGFGLK